MLRTISLFILVSLGINRGNIPQDPQIVIIDPGPDRYNSFPPADHIHIYNGAARWQGFLKTVFGWRDPDRGIPDACDRRIPVLDCGFNGLNQRKSLITLLLNSAGIENQGNSPGHDQIFDSTEVKAPETAVIYGF